MMKYFTINLNYSGRKIPRLLHLEDKIKYQTIFEKKAFVQDKPIVVEVKSDIELCPNIMTSPFFMVSKQVKGLIDKFEPNMEWNKVIIAGYQVNVDDPEYYVPCLDCIDVKTNKNFPITAKMLAEQNYMQKKLILDRKDIGKKAIFIMRNKSEKQVVMRMDMVEMFMRRDWLFEGIQEVEIE